MAKHRPVLTGIWKDYRMPPPVHQPSQATRACLNSAGLGYSASHRERNSCIFPQGVHLNGVRLEKGEAEDTMKAFFKNDGRHRSISAMSGPRSSLRSFTLPRKHRVTRTAQQ